MNIKYKITKIVINRGLNEKYQNAKALNISLQELSLITGQKPSLRKAKKAIAGKPREPRFQELLGDVALTKKDSKTA